MQENSPFNPVAPSPSSTHAAADSATPAFWPNASSAAPLAAAPPSYAPVASAANESGASSWGNAMDQTAASQNPALGTAASPAASPAASGNIVSLVATRDSGARWFLWIAGLSLVNALLMTFGSDHTFGLGLGSTLLVDAVAKDVATKTPQLLAGAPDRTPVRWCHHRVVRLVRLQSVARQKVGVFGWRRAAGTRYAAGAGLPDVVRRVDSRLGGVLNLHRDGRQLESAGAGKSRFTA